MRLYGLLGRQLDHSLSKKYFDDRFHQEQISDVSFQNYELENINAFPSLLESQPNLKGCTVTLPYKEAILDHVNEMSDAVQSIGACNVIEIGDKVIAHNTDYIGFWRSIESLLESQHTKALILGTGGAAKAVKYAFDQKGIESKMVSRSKSAPCISYEELKEHISDHFILVNATPVGMGRDHRAPDIPYSFLSAQHLVIDLIYTPENGESTRSLTPFLNASASSGARLKDGLEMLHLQADAAWDIWKIS